MPPRTIYSLLLVLSCLLLSTHVLAQAPPYEATASFPVQETAASKADVRALLDTLNDDAARAEFLSRLRGLVEAEGKPANVEPTREDWLTGATEALGTFSGSVIGAVGEIEELPAQAGRVFESLADPFVVERIGWALSMVAAVLAAAMLAEYVAKWLLSRPRRAVEARRAKAFSSRLSLLTIRTLLDILPIAAFAAAAFGVLALVDLNFIVRLAVVTIINANVLARLILAVGQAVLTPNTPQMRLFTFDDESAAYGYLWVKRFTHAAVYGYFLLRAAWVLGLSTAAYSLVGDVLGLLLAGMAIVFILQVRVGVTAWLRKLGSSDVSTAE